MTELNWEEIEATKRFKKAFKKKSLHHRKTVLKALMLFFENPSHPSLRFKPMKGQDGIYELRSSDGDRITLEYIEDDSSGVRLRNNCNHDLLTRSP